MVNAAPAVMNPTADNAQHTGDTDTAESRPRARSASEVPIATMKVM